MKKNYWVPIGIVIVIVAAIVIAASSSNREGEGVIKIGWIGPQTGQSAVLGMDSVVAAQIAVDEINSRGGMNGKQAVLIVEDDQYDIAKATSAYQKLVNSDGAKFILVNTYGSVFALAKQAERDGVILLDPLDCNGELAKLSNNVFCLATDSESIAEVLAAHANQKGYRKAGILYWNSDLFMPLVERVFVKNFNGTIVLAEAYSAGTSDFKTQLTKMINSGIDALVLLGYDETGIAMKQARDLGFKGQFYTTGTVTSPSLQQASQGHAEGSVFAYWDANKTTEPSKSFTQKFIEKQGRPAILDLASYPSYDAVMAFANAIEGAGSTKIQDVQAGLLNIENMSGVTGLISFASDGSMRIRESAFVLTNGKPVLAQ